MKPIVYDNLNFGRENAIPAKTLVELLGFRSKRDLQKEIERERNLGLVILTDFSGGGYFRSDDADELKKFTQTMKAKAENTLRALESAERALDAATEQERMEGWW